MRESDLIRKLQDLPTSGDLVHVIAEDGRTFTIIEVVQELHEEGSATTWIRVSED